MSQCRKAVLMMRLFSTGTGRILGDDVLHSDAHARQNSYRQKTMSITYARIVHILNKKLNDCNSFRDKLMYFLIFHLIEMLNKYRRVNHVAIFVSSSSVIVMSLLPYVPLQFSSRQSYVHTGTTLFNLLTSTSSHQTLLPNCKLLLTPYIQQFNIKNTLIWTAERQNHFVNSRDKPRKQQ